MSSCWYPYLKWSHTVTNICCSQVHLEIGKLCSLCRCWMKHWPMVSWDTSLSCNVKIRKPAAAVWSGSIVKSWLAWTLKTRRCFSSYSEWLQRSGCVCDCNAVADFECFSLLFFIFFFFGSLQLFSTLVQLKTVAIWNSFMSNFTLGLLQIFCSKPNIT